MSMDQVLKAYQAGRNARHLAGRILSDALAKKPLSLSMALEKYKEDNPNASKEELEEFRLFWMKVVCAIIEGQPEKQHEKLLRGVLENRADHELAEIADCLQDLMITAYVARSAEHATLQAGKAQCGRTRYFCREPSSANPEQAQQETPPSETSEPDPGDSNFAALDEPEDHSSGEASSAGEEIGLAPEEEDRK